MKGASLSLSFVDVEKRDFDLDLGAGFVTLFLLEKERVDWAVGPLAMRLLERVGGMVVYFVGWVGG